MGRMSNLHVELQDMAEFYIGKDDAKRRIRRATYEMSEKQRRAYNLGRETWRCEQYAKRHG